GSAAWHYRKLKVVSVRECLMGAGFTVIGAFIGTCLALTMAPALLKQLIPTLLMGVAIYMIFKPQLGEKDIHPRMKPWLFYMLAGFGIWFLGGFFCPGPGRFFGMGVWAGGG